MTFKRKSSPMNGFTVGSHLLFFTMIFNYGECACNLGDGVARCQQIAGKMDIHVTVTVNYCNKPPDITFQIQATNQSWSWQHTFVNEDETQPILGLRQDLRLHVIQGEAPSSGRQITANFMVDNYQQKPFLADVVPLRKCVRENNPNAYLPLVIFCILIVLIIILVIILILHRRQQHKKTTSELLHNVDDTSTTSIYQEEPPDRHYKDRGHTTTTVIKNAIYRDSVVLEGDSNNTPIANGVSNGISRSRPKREKEVLVPTAAINRGYVSGPHTHRHNKKKKSKHKYKNHTPRNLIGQTIQEEEVVLRVNVPPLENPVAITCT